VNQIEKKKGRRRGKSQKRNRATIDSSEKEGIPLRFPGTHTGFTVVEKKGKRGEESSGNKKERTMGAN